jgi:hypothetical protein
MERMNGELRQREKVMRTLEKPDTEILTELQIYHNYIRPHMALEGKTPAEIAGIEIKGKDKWLTLIQNASRNEKFSLTSCLSNYMVALVAYEGLIPRCKKPNLGYAQ